MKRTGFKSKRHEPANWREAREQQKQANLAGLCARPVARAGVYAGSASGEVVAKENASQSPTYQKACKALGYCMRCGARGIALDFCHRDQGKGKGIKTDVREGWPGCRPCHDFVGSSGKLPKEQRRAEELMLGAKTRAAVAVAGLWPKRLPLWNEA